MGDPEREQDDGSRPNPDSRLRPQLSDLPGALWLLPAAGVLALALYALSEDSWSIAASAVMAASAAFIVGSLLGFLFGIPRTLSERPAGPPSEDLVRRLDYEPNTNLEQISDWLTKILVGVGLVQLGELRQGVRDLVEYIAPGLGGDQTARAFALSLLVYFSIGGFLASYLFMRLRLQGAIARAERSLLEVVVAIGEKVEQGDSDATAITLVTRQLDGEEKVNVDELKVAIAAASKPAKVQIFFLARRQRYSTWRDDTIRMELTIPVFEALAEDDPERKYHRHYAELGFALKDKRQPECEGAIRHLDLAIEIRDKSPNPPFRSYEFVRALCRIELDPASSGRPSAPEVQELVVRDLAAAMTESRWQKKVQENDEIQAWMRANDLSVADLRRSG